MHLFCAIIGMGVALPIEIDDANSVSELKELIKNRSDGLIGVPWPTLQLFLAKEKTKKDTTEETKENNDKGEKWMTLLQFEKGVGDTDDLKLLNVNDATLRSVGLVSCKLGHVSEEAVAAGLGPVHVLVVIPETEESNPQVKKRRLEWQSTRRGSHTYNPNSQYFLLEQVDMDGSGLPPARLKIYCRPTFHNQFKFLQEKVLVNGHLGWIIGPSGSGKSTTTMAFALTVDRNEWVVTWIHGQKSSKQLWCIRLIGDKRETRTIDVKDVEEVLETEDESKRHVVFVDGLADPDDFSELKSACIKWFLKNHQKQRLVFVSSVLYRAKVDKNLDIQTRTLEFPVCSWTLDEYHSAVKDAEFWTIVSPYLDVPKILPDEEWSHEEMVDNKYHYAGGSCRDMFGLNTETVMENTSNAVNVVSDPAQRSVSNINRLCGMFHPPNTSRAIYPIISRNAAMEIGMRCGPETLKMFMPTREPQL